MILLVLGMVALFGFTALAVDGGMVYADRRQAQSGADASSLAGGGGAALYMETNSINFLNWDCAGNVAGALSAAESAAIARAADNGYTIDGNTSDNHGVDATCGQSSSGWPDRFIDVRSVITADTPTAFAHFVFSGPLRNTVEAVTRIRPRAPLAFGYAIVALSDECGGIDINGTSDTVVIGGGIFSNSCIVANGDTTITVTDGNIGCVGSGCFDTHGHPSVNPAPQQGQPSIPNDVLLVPPPNCDGLTSRADPSGSGTIQPGLYSSGIHINNHQVIAFDPGLYCISDGMHVNGGAEISGSGVTIYVMDGDIDVNGGATVNLAAPPAEDCENCPPAIPGVLIYLADGNAGEVTLLGNGESNYVGTVYAPDGEIEVGGTGDSINYHSQLIGWTVRTHGNAILDVTYEGENNYQQPAVLELYK